MQTDAKRIKLAIVAQKCSWSGSAQMKRLRELDLNGWHSPTFTCLPCQCGSISANLFQVTFTNGVQLKYHRHRQPEAPDAGRPPPRRLWKSRASAFADAVLETYEPSDRIRRRNQHTHDDWQKDTGFASARAMSFQFQALMSHSHMRLMLMARGITCVIFKPMNARLVRAARRASFLTLFWIEKIHSRRPGIPRAPRLPSWNRWNLLTTRTRVNSCELVWVVRDKTQKGRHCTKEQQSTASIHIDTSYHHCISLHFPLSLELDCLWAQNQTQTNAYLLAS